MSKEKERRTRTVYEKLTASDRMNEAVKEIENILYEKKLSISECTVVLTVLKQEYVNKLFENKKVIR